MATDKAPDNHPNPLKWILAITKKWLTPHSTDPEESFRETAIRIAYPIIVCARPTLIWYRHVVEKRPVPGPLSVEILFVIWAVLAASSLIALSRRRTGLSGILLVLITAHGNLLGILTVGYWDAFLRTALMVDVMIAAILLPTSYLFLYTFSLIGAFGILTHIVTISPASAPPPSEVAPNPLIGTISVAATFFVEVAVIGFLRNEVAKRLAAQQELINTLEDRVAERTAELEAANEHLRALSRVKDEFVSNVSHELRTPITNIKLYHSLLTHRPEKRDEYVPVLTRETERLERLIEDLLTLSRLDQERVDFRLTQVDLNALVQAYTADRTLLAESREVSLTFDREADLPKIEADPSLLGQVLSILLTNAFNYTPKGGQVVVSTRQRQTDAQRWVGFSVSDTGPGIPPEEQKQLFTRFFRGKTGRESEVPGTGLGLAIAKEIVERHHGLIAVESEGTPGQGATFSVWLPVQKD